MSQPSGPPLHPVLRAALSSLDRQLEIELTQYRCHRAVRSLSPLVQEANQTRLNKTPATAPGDLAVISKSVETGLVFASGSQNPGLATSDPEDACLLELTRSRLLTEKPEGYLASSEALLKNLPEIKTPKEFSPIKVLLTAWGITLIIVLLSSIAVGYLLIHLSGPNRFKLVAQEPKGSTPSPADLVPKPKVKDAEVANPAAMSTPNLAISPDLSAEEFVKLDLPNLSQLKPSPEPTLQTTPGAKVTTTGSASAGQVPTKDIPVPPPGQGRSQAPKSPKPPATLKSQKPRVTPTTATPPRKDRYYYVLVNSTSGKSLQQAQKVIKDAHVRKFPEGKRLQIGAFNDHQSAQKLVQELKRQGVPAAVRKPTPTRKP